MPLSDIVNVNITAVTNSPTRPGFGTPLFVAYTTSIPARTLEFGSLAEMVTQGFTSTTSAYKGCSKLVAQSPRVTSWKVGKSTASFVQTVTLTCTAGLTAALNYIFSVGTTELTVAGTGTANGDAAAINTAINALSISGLTCTNPSSPSPNVRLVMSAGLLLDVKPDIAHMTLADTTTGPSTLADELDAIVAYDNNWYGLLMENNGKAAVILAAAWAETHEKLYIYNTSDSACMDSGSTTDVMYALKASSYARTAGLMSASQLLSFSSAAWMGNRFPFDPGTENWAFKTLASVTVDNLSTAQIHAVENKNGNVYTTVAGLNITQFGKSASGEFLDITRFIDWLKSELQIQVFALLANNNKLPYTDAGIDTIRATIMSVLQEGIDRGGLSSLPAPVVVCPLVADIDPVTRATRNVPNVTFSATLAGAINSLTINGTLSV